MYKDLIVKRYFKIEGMTCHSCEKKIVSLCNTLPEVAAGKADFVKGHLVLELTEEPFSSGKIIKLIEDAGYSGQEISKFRKLYSDFLPVLIGGIIISIIYLAEKNTGFLSRIPEIREGLSYPVLFIIGALTSIHCIGMCGGINLSQTSSRSIDVSKMSTVKRSIQYNTGRILSYTVLGGIVGGIGSIFSLSASVQGGIIIAAGIIMIILGCNMMGLFSTLRKLIPVIPESVSNRIFSKSSKRNPFVVGILNGFMPCGPLQSMQVYALSTGSIVKGAFSMFLFSSGTVPLMFIFGTLSIFFSRRFQKNILRISALLIIVLGWGMISRGLSLNGLGVNSQNAEEVAVNAAVAKMDGDIQRVTSDVSPYGYEPIIVQAGVPVQWILEAGPGDITGCNNAIVSRKFGIKQSLSEGQTIVEFTPEETGNFSFTCWMGMIDSNILVVDDLESFDPELLSTPADTSADKVDIQIPDFGVEDIQLAALQDGGQSVELQIDESGISPSIIVMERDLKAEWIFNPGVLDDKTQSLIFPTFNARIDLQNGTSQIVEITPVSDFYYYSQKGDFLGFVIVVDDLNSIGKDAVLNTVNSYISR